MIVHKSDDGNIYKTGTLETYGGATIANRTAHGYPLEYFYLEPIPEEELEKIIKLQNWTWNNEELEGIEKEIKELEARKLKIQENLFQSPHERK